MHIKIFYGTDDTANSYLLYDEKQVAVLFDPHVPSKKIIEFLKDNQLDLQAIFLTHAHFDHVGGVEDILKAYDCPVYLSSFDEPLLRNPKKNGSSFFACPMSFNFEITPIEEEKTFAFSSFHLQVLFTPFHTAGSVMYYVPEGPYLFSGDTLFKHNIGRSDLPSGSVREIPFTLEKIRKFYEKEGNMKVYPGHGEETELQKEIPYFSYFLD